MIFEGLTKQKKQYLALGAIGAVALVVVIVFGVKVSLSSIGEAQVELEDLTRKIESADRALSKQEQVRKEFFETSEELKGMIRIIPPQRNYYSWATEIIYAKARQAGLEVDAVDEQTNMGMVEPDDAEAGSEIKLESYALRITAHGGYTHVMNFLEKVEKDHPLVRVTGIDISTGSDPETHDVQFFIEWPFNLGFVTDSWDVVAKKKQMMERGSSRETSNGENK